METKKNKIYFLCPDIAWEKPTSGGLLYNYVYIKALKKQYGDEAVIPLNLNSACKFQSWGKLRVTTNLKYLKFLFREKLRHTDLILVDSRSNSLLLLPLLFVHFFSKVTIGVIVYHIYYHLSGRRKLLGIIEKFSEKQFIRSASFIITISRSTRKDIMNLTGMSESRKVPIQIISPGLRGQSDKVIYNVRNKNNSSELKLLYVGTCDDPRKGLDYLVQAIAKLPYLHFKLHLIGKYNDTNFYYKKLVQSIEDFNLKGKILFLGRVSDEKLNQFYSESDIFVFPSLWEGYGIVLAEAMARGLPVIATDISSIPELVQNGVNGILVPPGSIDSLAEALAELIDNNELRRRMAKKSVEIAKNFKSWDEVGQALISFTEKSLL